jgi:hypothetical protein
VALSKADKKKLVDLKRKKLALLKQHEAQLDYEHSNKIEFFGIVDEKRGWAHSSENEDSHCKCNLFKGPNPLQKKLLEAWGDPSKKVFTYTGANRIGKTTILAIIAICSAHGKWLWNGEKIDFGHNKPVKIRIVGQDWEKHIKQVLIPALREWWPSNSKVKVKKNSIGVEAEWIVESTLGSIEIMSNNQDSDLHEGWNGDLIEYDEPPKRHIRIANARGLADRDGRELFSMTLLKEAWVDREVIKARNEDGTPDTSVCNVSGDIYSNLGFGLTKKGVDNLIKKLSPDEISARIHGIPSYMTGLIYPQFDREMHLKKRFDIPLDWIIDIGIDCHPAKEQAVLFMATDPRNYKYLIDEIWMHGDGTQLADEIMRRVGRSRYRVNTVLIDHSAKGDSNQEFTTYAKIDEVLNRYQLSLDTYKKDEDGGIKQARTLLKGPNNKPSLSVFNDLPRTIYEIEGYMYDDKTQKVQNHTNDMMDNLYALANEDTQWYPIRPKSRVSRQTNWRVA